MPIAKVELPDGRIARFEVPEGTSQDDVMRFASDRFKIGTGEFSETATDKVTGNVFYTPTGEHIASKVEPKSGAAYEPLPTDVFNQTIGESVRAGAPGFLGETGGAIGGAMMGARAGSLLGPAGTIAGGALGAGIGGATGLAAGMKVNNADISPEEALMAFGANAVGEGVGATLLGAGQRAVGRALLPETPASDAADFKKLNLPITPDVVMGGDIIPNLVAIQKQAPITGYLLRKAHKEAGDAIQSRIAEIVGSVNGGGLTPERAGRKIEELATGAYSRIYDKINTFYDGLLSEVPNDMPFNATKAKAYIAEKLNKIPANEQARANAGYDELKKLSALVNDEPLTAMQAKEQRQFLREQAEALRQNRKVGVARVYDEFSKVLNDDIGDEVGKYVKDGAALYKRADKKAQGAYALRDTISRFTGDSARNRTGEALIAEYMRATNSGAMKSAKGSDAALLRGLHAFGDKELLGQIAGYHIENMGLKNGEFVPEVFVREWKSISPEAKRMLFKNQLNPSQYAALNTMANYISKFKGSLNSSGTAPVYAELATLGSAGAALGAAVSPPTALYAALPVLSSFAMSSSRLGRLVNKLPRSAAASAPFTPTGLSRLVSAMTAAGFTRQEIDEVNKYAYSKMQ